MSPEKPWRGFARLSEHLQERAQDVMAEMVKVSSAKHALHEAAWRLAARVAQLEEQLCFVTTMMGCRSCDQGERPRYMRFGYCVDCLAKFVPEDARAHQA